MQLTKSVGKGCYCTSQNDVLMVQTALANIKHRNKPHYCGKIDGKDGPKTEVAIAEFQSCCGIKATGKVESYGPTINKLRQKTPMSVKGRLNGGIATPAAASVSDTAKVKATAHKTAEHIRKKEPLPKKEAEALAKIVMDAADVGVPLTYKRTDISNDGRFIAELDIAPFAQIAHCGNGDHRKKMIQKVSQFVGKYGAWQMGPSQTLIYQSATPRAYLSSTHTFKDGFIKASGLKRPQNDKRMERFVAASEYLMTLRAEARTQKLLELSAIVKTLNPTQAQIIASLIKPDRSKFRFMADAAFWTHKQMIANAGGPEAKNLIEINKVAQEAQNKTNAGEATPVFGPLALTGESFETLAFKSARLTAYGYWVPLVMPSGIWDLKAQEPLSARAPNQGTALYDPNSKVSWERDVWGNIHYGYIGRAVGFSRAELEGGAGIAQIVTMAKQVADGNSGPIDAGLRRLAKTFNPASLDPYDDNAAVRLGMDLWDGHGTGLAFDIFIRKVRENKQILNTK